MSDAGARTYLPLSRVAAVGVGNALEFYDFLTFSFFSVQIGHCFFPADQFGNSLLFSLATFGVGFIARPFGGLVIGRYGDRAGRRPAMVLSFALMGIGIVGLALTPSYAAIGLAGPVLLTLFRLLQGFALGGEVGPSTAYLIEVAPDHRRGLYVSLQYATQDVAVLVAGLVGFTLSNLLAPQDLDDWGWRVAFLLGAAIVPVGLRMRRSLPESLDEREVAESPAVPRRLVVLGLALLAAGTIGSYVIDYMTTYAEDSLQLPVSAAFGATIVTGLCNVCVEPLCGMLSDRYGRRPVSLVGAALLLPTVIPAFILVTWLHSALALYGVTALLTILQCFFSVPVLIAIAEGLPKAIRSGALAIIYAVSIAVFGGSAQFIVKLAIDTTGSKLAPGVYLFLAIAVGLGAMLLMYETAPLARQARRA